jgi:hypothetical protein
MAFETELIIPANQSEREKGLITIVPYVKRKGKKLPRPKIQQMGFYAGRDPPRAPGFSF